jgi:tripartite-type tricarboxylate transporter receptor subunit TctC
MKLASIFRIISAVVSGIVLSGASTSAFAQAKDYPTRPIRLIVPAAPGGTTDGLARIFGGRLTEM